jgi:hypothetical protein
MGMADDAVDGEPGGGGTSAFPSDASPTAVATTSCVEHVPALPPPGCVDRDEVVPVLAPAAAVAYREVFPSLLPSVAVAYREVFPALPLPASALGDDLVVPFPRPALTEGAQLGHSFEVSSHCKYEVQFSLCSRSSDSK